MRSESKSESPVIEEVYRILRESRRQKSPLSPSVWVEKLQNGLNSIRREPEYLIPTLAPTILTLVGFGAQNAEMIEVCGKVTIGAVGIAAFCYGCPRPIKRWLIGDSK